MKYLKHQTVKSIVYLEESGRTYLPRCCQPIGHARNQLVLCTRCTVDGPQSLCRVLRPRHRIRIALWAILPPRLHQGRAHDNDHNGSNHPSCSLDQLGIKSVGACRVVGWNDPGRPMLEMQMVNWKRNEMDAFLLPSSHHFRQWW